MLKGIQSARAERLNARFKKLTRQEIFQEIYNKGLWGVSTNKTTQPFLSGSGSRDKHIVESYVEAVGTFLRSLPEKPSVVDLGCGDFLVGSQIRPLCGKYVAGDIVKEVIDINKSRFSDLNVEFLVLDIINDDLPRGDIVFLRQVLQHLSNDDINIASDKLAEKYKYIVVTEHVPGGQFYPNLDKSTGPGIRLERDSGVVLTSPPFNLAVNEEKILCEVPGYGGVIRTILYRMRD